MLEFNKTITPELEEEYISVFEDCEVRESGSFYNNQMFVDFPNGYTASVLKGRGTHGVEVAVIYDGRIVYDTPVTNTAVSDIPGFTEMLEVLKDIKALPERS